MCECKISLLKHKFFKKFQNIGKTKIYKSILAFLKSQTFNQYLHIIPFLRKKFKFEYEKSVIFYEMFNEVW